MLKKESFIIANIIHIKKTSFKLGINKSIFIKNKRFLWTFRLNNRQKATNEDQKN